MSPRRWILLAFFVALPLANTLTLDVGFPVTMSHVFVLVLAALQLREIHTGGMRLVWLPATLFLAFCVIYATSAIVNIGSAPTFEWATGRDAPIIRSITKVLWLVGNVIASVVVANEVRRQHAGRAAMQALVLGAVATSLYGFYQVVGQSHAFFVPLLPGTEFIDGTASFWIVPRAKSTFLEPSFFGAYLAVVLPFAMVCFAGVRATLLATTAIMMGIVVTFSIAGWLSAAVGGLVLLGLMVGPHGLRWAGPFAAGGLAAMLIIFVSIPGMPRAVSAVIDKGTIASGSVLVGPQSGSPTPTQEIGGDPPEAAARSAAERVATTQAAIAMFQSRPVLGVGPGNFSFRYAEFRPKGTAEPDQLLIANNIYAELLAEVGLLGFLAFLAAMGKLALLTLHEVFRSIGPARSHLAAVTAALGALAASLLVAPSFTILYQWSMVGLGAALLIAHRATPNSV